MTLQSFCRRQYERPEPDGSGDSHRCNVWLRRARRSVSPKEIDATIITSDVVLRLHDGGTQTHPAQKATQKRPKIKQNWLRPQISLWSVLEKGLLAYRASAAIIGWIANNPITLRSHDAHCVRRWSKPWPERPGCVGRIRSVDIKVRVHDHRIL